MRLETRGLHECASEDRVCLVPRLHSANRKSVLKHPLSCVGMVLKWIEHRARGIASLSE